MNTSTDRNTASNSESSGLIKDLYVAVSRNQFPEAFRLAREYASVSQDSSVFDTLQTAEESYKAMMRYGLAEAGDDAVMLYGDTREALLRAADMFRFRSLREGSLDRYYNNARSLSVTPHSIAEAVVEALNADKAASATSMAGIADEALAQRRDEALATLFNRIWGTPHISSSDHEALRSIIENKEAASYVRMQVLAALWLSMQAFYDYAKLDLLACGAVQEHPGVAARGIAGVLLTLMRHQRRLEYNPRATARIETLLEVSGMSQALTEASFCVAKAMDTDRINRKMQTDIIPDLQKMQHDLMARFGERKDTDLLNPEKNPEWEDILEQSGMGDKLRELTDLQMEGSDVMMLAFSQLKSFSFFTPVANWFLPFIPSHSALADARRIDSEGVLFNTVFSAGGFLCDSDKYSLALSLGRTPESQRRMMTDRLREQYDQLKEEGSTSLEEMAKPEINSEILLYIRNLYRFYRLYQYRNEFDDPFRSAVDIAALPCVGDALATTEALELMAEFYFNREYYSEAVRLLNHLLAQAPMENTLQKLGYAYMKLGEYNKAINFFTRCEDMYGSGKWLLRQLAHTHRAAGNYSLAAQYYARALEKEPDNLSITRQLANMMMSDNRFDEALKLYYKLEYVDGPTLRNMRPVAWCEFLCDNYLRSGVYYDKITESSEASPVDYMNAGHLALVTHDLPHALELYAKARAGLGDKFRTTMLDDARILKEKGVAPVYLHIIIDRLEYGI